MLIAIAWVIGIILAVYLVARTVVYFRREAQDISPHPEPPEEILRPGHRHR
jgi:hypothetical protein